MNILLVFFAIPLATIILSSIFETLIESPFKVSGIFFSIYIVIAFYFGGTAELVLAALIYTVISFLAALMTSIVDRNFCDRIRKINSEKCYMNNEFTDLKITNDVQNYVDTPLIESSNNLAQNNQIKCRRYR